mgnify:FL=1
MVFEPINKKGEKVSQDFFDDTWVVDEAEYSQPAAALGASQWVDKIHIANEARPVRSITRLALFSKPLYYCRSTPLGGGEFNLRKETS